MFKTPFIFSKLCLNNFGVYKGAVWRKSEVPKSHSHPIQQYELFEFQPLYCWFYTLHCGLNTLPPYFLRDRAPIYMWVPRWPSNQNPWICPGLHCTGALISQRLQTCDFQMAKYLGRSLKDSSLTVPLRSKIFRSILDEISTKQPFLRCIQCSAFGVWRIQFKFILALIKQ